MKKRKILIIICFCIIFLLIILVLIFNYKKESIKINIEEDKKIIDNNNILLKNIFDNMENISIKNNNYDVSWTYYKLKLDDSSQRVYDNVVANIRNCYIQYRDLDNNDFVKELQNHNEITKKQFNKIKDYYLNKECFNKFNDYFYYDFPYESDLPDTLNIKELKIVVNPVLWHFKRIPKIDNYEELLKEEYYELSLLNNITEFLNLKYSKENK